MPWLALVVCACSTPEDGPDAQVVAVIPPDAAVAAAACPAPSGQETAHQGDITTAETWAGDGTVHRITFGITIRPGASLTFAPCAVVKVNDGLVLTISGTPAAPAKLVSQGSPTRPVLITSSAAGKRWGTWRGLTPQSTAELSYTTLENGGAGGRGASLSLQGGGAPEREAIPVLKVDHLVIKDSAGTGLILEGGAAFTADSTELTVTGGGAIAGSDHAIEINAIAAGTLPELNASGNAHDAVRVAGSLHISRDLTLKNRGVPYHFYFDRVRITDPNGGVVPTLTVEAGVELRFDDYLVVGQVNPGVSNHPGKLIAIGSPAQPIVFTSSKATPAAGDWPGIWLFNSPGSRLENVTIEYAGGLNGIVSANCKPAGTSDDAALFIGSKSSAYVPAATDLVGVHISHSRGHGINAMWETAGGYTPDLTSGVTFESINGCSQTRNSTRNGCVGGVGCLVP